VHIATPPPAGRPTPEPVPAVNPAAATDVIAKDGNVWLPDMNWYFFGPLRSYSTAIKATVSGMADRLFVALVAIELLISICRGVLANEDFFAMMSTLSIKLITFNVAYWLLVKNGFVLAMVIISSFAQVGLLAGHSVYTTYDNYQKDISYLPRSDEAPTDPFGIILYGISTAKSNAIKASALSAVPNEVLGTGWTNLFQYEEQISLFAVLATVGGYVFIAGTLTLALFEAYIVLSVGILMTGFLGSRWTQQLGASYFSYAISVGVKLMMVYVCLGLATPLSAMITDTGWVSGLLSASFAGISAMICWAAPNFAASLITGSSRLNFTNLAASFGRVALAGAMLPNSPFANAGKPIGAALDKMSSLNLSSFRPSLRSMPPNSKKLYTNGAPGQIQQSWVDNHKQHAASTPLKLDRSLPLKRSESVKAAVKESDRKKQLASGAPDTRPGTGVAGSSNAQSRGDWIRESMGDSSKFVTAFGTDTENSDSGITGAAPIRL
jgi:hypothetical protein